MCRLRQEVIFHIKIQFFHKILKELEQEYKGKVRILIRDKDAYPGKSAVLNDAVKIAKGEAYLVFDADATVEPDFLNKLIPSLEPADVGAVQARKIIRNKDVNFLTRCQNNEYTLILHNSSRIACRKMRVPVEKSGLLSAFERRHCL